MIFVGLIIMVSVVQPALYEAFGLTVIEAMTCGLPTFATCKGGPAEIIIDGISGFHIDPNNGDEASDKIANFFEKCKSGPAEIIIDGVSGFHIDPNNGDEASEKIAKFFEKCKTITNYWNVVSDAGLQRIYKRYLITIYILVFNLSVYILYPISFSI